MNDITKAEPRNARITSTMLGNEDHGIFTCFLMLDYGGAGQGFGGFALDAYDKTQKSRIGTAYGMEFLRRVLKVLDVPTWEKLPGTFCRVLATHSKVEAIGHPLRDDWFYPETLLGEIEKAAS